MPGARRHAYQQPDSTLTLREGLREYFDSNPNLLDPDEPEQAGSPEAAELFKHHDVVHIVFGTNTDVGQEAMTDTWAMAATDVGWRTYMGYLRQPEAMAIFNSIGWARAMWESFKAIPAVLGVLRRARRMSKRWPWKHHDQYLDVPLRDIRQEFNIDVFQPGA